MCRQSGVAAPRSPWTPSGRTGISGQWCTSPWAHYAGTTPSRLSTQRWTPPWPCWSRDEGIVPSRRYQVSASRRRDLDTFQIRLAVWRRFRTSRGRILRPGPLLIAPEADMAQWHSTCKAKKASGPYLSTQPQGALNRQGGLLDMIYRRTTSHTMLDDQKGFTLIE